MASSRPSRCWTAIACGVASRRTFQKPIPMRSTAWRLDHGPAPAGQPPPAVTGHFEDIASHPLGGVLQLGFVPFSARLLVHAGPVAGQVIATFAMYYFNPRGRPVRSRPLTRLKPRPRRDPTNWRRKAQRSEAYFAEAETDADGQLGLGRPQPKGAPLLRRNLQFSDRISLEGFPTRTNFGSVSTPRFAIGPTKI